MKVLVTGTAGFIGFHLARRLLARGDEVVGVDSVNDYYDVRLKYGRLAETGIAESRIAYGRPVQSTTHPNYRFVQLNLADGDRLKALVRDEFGPRTAGTPPQTPPRTAVVNLAAQAGVRYSLINPDAYIESNIVGFTHILEACRHSDIDHLAYASSSSVYGLNETMPFSTSHNVDHPVSLYAASKKSNELMAHCYSHLYGLPTTGLRFFTVYGPWGRPDMALFLFTKAILEGRAIDVFNRGNMKRDFTYIDDIVEGVVRVIDSPPAGNPDWSGAAPDPGSSRARYKVYNIGNSRPVQLLDFIGAIETALGREAEKNLLPMQPGDVPATFADTTDLERDLGYRPDTPIQTGVDRFIAWYRGFYGV